MAQNDLSMLTCVGLRDRLTLAQRSVSRDSSTSRLDTELRINRHRIRDSVRTSGVPLCLKEGTVRCLGRSPVDEPE